MEPDFSKFHHFGHFLKIFGNIFKVSLVWGKVFNSFLYNLYAFGRIFNAENMAKYWKHNLVIWSRWLEQSIRKTVINYLIYWRLCLYSLSLSLVQRYYKNILSEWSQMQGGGEEEGWGDQCDQIWWNFATFAQYVQNFDSLFCKMLSLLWQMFMLLGIFSLL